MERNKKKNWILLFLGIFFIDRVTTQYNNSEESLSDERDLTKPCLNYKPGEDDLQTIDFMRRYNLDAVGEQYLMKVSKVKGTNNMQIAYRLTKEADITIPIKDIFPFGLPEEFSLVITMRNNKLSKVPWDLMRIVNLRNEREFAITLNSRRQIIEFSILDDKNNMQIIIFPAPQIFNKNWHKIQFGVFAEKVILYIDCKKLDTKELKLRRNINVSGKISLSKLVNANVTMPIDLQWMVLNCDPTGPERESCEEIPDSTESTKKKLKKCENMCAPLFNVTIGSPNILEAELKDKKEIPGPPGFPGEKGQTGAPGPEGPLGPPGNSGFPGAKGDTGLPGPMGPPGPACSPCYQNPKYFSINENGSLENYLDYSPSSGTKENDGKSEIFYSRKPPGSRRESEESNLEGRRGPAGVPGRDGNPGLVGKEGPVGAPGAPGAPGNTGPPGHSSDFITEETVKNICLRIWAEKISEMTEWIQSPPSSTGSRPRRRGPPGPAGPPGNPGSPGERGPDGPPGPEGPVGPPGIDGARGEKGEEGDKGIGILGPTGFQGPPGPSGINGKPGQPGRPGDRGEPGRPGQPGLHGQPGVIGPPGFCEFCNYPNVQYTYSGKGP